MPGRIIIYVHRLKRAPRKKPKAASSGTSRQS
jgi:hypothetical protein